VKYFISIVFLFSVLLASAQNDVFLVEGKIIGVNNQPVTDAYIFNARNMDKNISNSKGVFSVWVRPNDTLIISHISYFRKTVTVFSLLTNPTIQLDVDTITIEGVSISPNQKTDYEKAMKNIESIKFDFRAKPFDSYTETERIQELMNTENRALRVEASSISLLRFSPSKQIEKLVDKIKKRKKSRKNNRIQKKKKNKAKKERFFHN
jgi:hypothetical protein